MSLTGNYTKPAKRHYKKQKKWLSNGDISQVIESMQVSPDTVAAVRRFVGEGLVRDPYFEFENKLRLDLSQEELPDIGKDDLKLLELGSRQDMSLEMGRMETSKKNEANSINIEQGESAGKDREMIGDADQPSTTDGGFGIHGKTSVLVPEINEKDNIRDAGDNNSSEDDMGQWETFASLLGLAPVVAEQNAKNVEVYTGQSETSVEISQKGSGHGHDHDTEDIIVLEIKKMPLQCPRFDIENIVVKHEAGDKPGDCDLPVVTSTAVEPEHSVPSQVEPGISQVGGTSSSSATMSGRVSEKANGVSGAAHPVRQQARRQPEPARPKKRLRKILPAPYSNPRVSQTQTGRLASPQQSIPQIATNIVLSHYRVMTSETKEVPEVTSTSETASTSSRTHHNLSISTAEEMSAVTTTSRSPIASNVQTEEPQWERQSIQIAPNVNYMAGGVVCVADNQAINQPPAAPVHMENASSAQCRDVSSSAQATSSSNAFHSFQREPPVPAPKRVSSAKRRQIVGKHWGPTTPSFSRRSNKLHLIPYITFNEAKRRSQDIGVDAAQREINVFAALIKARTTGPVLNPGVKGPEILGNQCPNPTYDHSHNSSNNIVGNRTDTFDNHRPSTSNSSSRWGWNGWCSLL